MDAAEQHTGQDQDQQDSQGDQDQARGNQG
jgi:hypothetical protein